MVRVASTKDLYAMASEDTKKRNAKEFGIATKPVKKLTIADITHPLPVRPREYHKAVIKMVYPNSHVTENHYLGRKGNRSFMLPDAKAWANDLIEEIKCCGVSEWIPPLKVSITGVFKNKRSRPDVHNFKLVYDCIEKVTGLNDKEYETATKPGVIDSTQTPYILITIEEIVEPNKGVGKHAVHLVSKQD